VQIFQIFNSHYALLNYIPKKLFPSMYYPMTSNLKALVVVIDAPCSHQCCQSSQLNATLFIAIHVSKIVDNIPNKSQSLLLVMCLESLPGFHFKGLQSYPNSLLVVHPSMSSKSHSTNKKVV